MDVDLLFGFQVPCHFDSTAYFSGAPAAMAGGMAGGVAAGLNKKGGVIGGLPIPPVQRFISGFANGVEHGFHVACG